MTDPPTNSFEIDIFYHGSFEQQQMKQGAGPPHPLPRGKYFCLMKKKIIKVFWSNEQVSTGFIKGKEGLKGFHLPFHPSKNSQKRGEKCQRGISLIIYIYSLFLFFFIFVSSTYDYGSTYPGCVYLSTTRKQEAEGARESGLPINGLQKKERGPKKTFSQRNINLCLNEI